MFKPGDTIVHARHGTGTVEEHRKITRNDITREYLCIKLTANNSLIMIPLDSLDEDEIRPAMVDLDLIADVLTKPPQPLDNDHRERQSIIRDMLKSRDPRQLTRALRDLCWREYESKLTFTDSQLRDKAYHLLAQELALSSASYATEARQRIESLITQAIERHAVDGGMTTATAN